MHERPWATVARVPLAERLVWLKLCAPPQAFETRLAAAALGAVGPTRQ